MANHKLSIYVAAGLIVLGSSVPAMAIPFHKEQTPTISATSTPATPEIAAADDKVNRAKEQLETAKKQLDAARAMLRAANADYKAAIADRQALELRTTAQDLANSSGLQSGTPANPELAVKPTIPPASSESAPVPALSSAPSASIQDAAGTAGIPATPDATAPPV